MTQYTLLLKDKAVIPWMEKPECWGYPGPDPMVCPTCIAYNNHLSTATRIPLSSIPQGWVDGMVIPETDLRFGYEGKLPDGNWIPINSTYYHLAKGEKRIIAHPITAVEQKGGEYFADLNPDILSVPAPFAKTEDELDYLWNRFDKAGNHAAANSILTRIKQYEAWPTPPPVKGVEEAGKDLYEASLIHSRKVGQDVMDALNDERKIDPFMITRHSFLAGASWKSTQGNESDGWVSVDTELPEECE